jgi:hypothetical protein
MAKFTKVTEFRADDVTVSFVPTSDVPGFSHRVLLLNSATRSLVARDWLSVDATSSAKTAQYFYSKHVGA